MKIAGQEKINPRETVRILILKKIKSQTSQVKSRQRTMIVRIVTIQRYVIVKLVGSQTLQRAEVNPNRRKVLTMGIESLKIPNRIVWGLI